MRLVPAKPRLYLGEVFTFDVQFFRLEGDPLQFTEIPADGFSVGKMQ